VLRLAGCLQGFTAWVSLGRPVEHRDCAAGLRWSPPGRLSPPRGRRSEMPGPRSVAGPIPAVDDSATPSRKLEGCGATPECRSAAAAKGVHPSRAGLGLLPGGGAEPEPVVSQCRQCSPARASGAPRLAGCQASLPVSHCGLTRSVTIAVPTSDVLCLFWSVICAAGPVTVVSTAVGVAGPARELQAQVCRNLLACTSK
jgi:hypothetical protein